MESSLADSEDPIEQLVRVSRRVGERWDLVQAGGGNTSIKLSDRTMVVKASGVRLSSVTGNSGFCRINNLKLREAFLAFNWNNCKKKQEREHAATVMVAEATMDAMARPSIETLLHAILDGAVIHTHPLPVVAVFSDSGSKDRENALLPEFARVPYETPGVDLALAMWGEREKYLQIRNREPRGFILQNHGLVVAASTPQIAFEETEAVCEMLSRQIGFPLEVERRVNRISESLRHELGEDWVTLHSHSGDLESVPISRPFFPDGVVFLGFGMLDLSGKKIEVAIPEYIQNFGVPPRAFFWDGQYYFSGPSTGRALESEEVFRFHVLGQKYGRIDASLPDREIDYLAHWEAEKYRQRV